MDTLQDAQELAQVQAVLQTPTSIGGIRGRSVDDAIRQIEDAYKSGARYVAGSDISGFFTKIPRAKVVEFLKAQAEDTEFIDLVERAMTVELANAEQLDPSELSVFLLGADGVAQGCPLSALAGNIVLREFDVALNEPGRNIVCLRYVDDFVLLGTDLRSVRKALDSAGRILSKFGMNIYDPNERPDKAFIGPIEAGHDFLGYRIVPGLYPPSQKACSALLATVASELRRGRDYIRRAAKGRPSTTRSDCYAQTLSRVDQILRGWRGAFRSTSCTQTMVALDSQIDNLLHHFQIFFDGVLRRSSPLEARRAFGVCLLQDFEKDLAPTRGSENKPNRAA